MNHPNHHTTAAQMFAMSRTQLIAWLTWNDPNGCYSDENFSSEFPGCDLLTREQLLALALEQADFADAEAVSLSFWCYSTDGERTWHMNRVSLEVLS